MSTSSGSPTAVHGLWHTLPLSYKQDVYSYFKQIIIIIITTQFKS